MFRTQIAAHIAKNVDFFQPRMRLYLARQHLSFTSYVKAFARGQIWSDIFTVGAIVHMWNVSVTIISPMGKDVSRIHHNMDVPDVIIVANGDKFGNSRAATYFAATEHLSNTSKIVPSNKANQDRVEKLHGFTNGYKEGTKVLFVHESERLLKDHYFLSKRLQKLREKVASCEKDLDVIEKHMGLLGYDQECFERFRRHMDNIMENTPHSGQETIAKEQDQQMFRIPRINVKDIFGDVIMSELARKRKATEPCELPKSKKVSTELNEDHEPEPNHVIECENLTLDRREQGNKEIEIGGTDEMEEESDGREEMGKQIQREIQEDEIQEVEVSSKTPSSQEIVKEPTNTKEQEKGSRERIETHGEDAEIQEAEESNEVEETKETEEDNEQTKEGTKQTEEKEEEHTDEAEQRNATMLPSRYNRRATSPIPKDKRIDGRHYCEKCEKNYKERKDLYRHIREKCGKVEKQLKCNQCGKDFYDKESFLNHIDRHNNTPQHKCLHCSEVFYERKLRKIHMDRFHANK